MSEEQDPGSHRLILADGRWEKKFPQARGEPGLCMGFKRTGGGVREMAQQVSTLTLAEDQNLGSIAHMVAHNHP